MRRTNIAVLTLLFAAPGLFGQAVEYDDARKVWLLKTRQSAYAMGVAPDGALLSLYWGAPLWRASDLPAASGGARFFFF